jgi:prepilin-type processing-associated H-X9-DG protein
MEDCVFAANRRKRAPLLARVEVWKKGKYHITATDVEVETAGIRHAFAIIDYKAGFVQEADGKAVSYKGTDLVKLVNLGPAFEQVWQLLSIDGDLMWSAAQGADIQMAITPIAHPEVEEPAAKCRMNIEQVGFTTMGIAREFDGKLAVAKKAASGPPVPTGKAPWSPLKRALAAYDDPKGHYFVLNRLHCPGDVDHPEQESYAFNTKLEGVELARLTEPANTVLLYEARDGKPYFSHDCRAAIFFADGHVEMISEEQAGTLRWTP